MGEWQAWHPTVSRPSRSTDMTDAFGPGTRWSAGPESSIDEVVAGVPVSRAPPACSLCRRCSGWRCSGWLGCRCSCWLCHRCSGWLGCRCSGRRRLARCVVGVPVGGVPDGWVGGVPAGCVTGVPGAAGPARHPRRKRRSARRLEARPGRGPVGALLTGGAWSVVSGQAWQPRRCLSRWWRVVGCLASAYVPRDPLCLGLSG